MSLFQETLMRLQGAASDTQYGLGSIRTVHVNDLQELLYHFYRLDKEVRELHAEKVQREYGVGTEKAREVYAEKVSNRYDKSPYELMRRETVDNIHEMEEYMNEVTATMEKSIEALKRAGILTDSGEIAPQYKRLFQNVL